MKKIILALIYVPVYFVIFWIAVEKDGLQTLFTIISLNDVQKAIFGSFFYCLIVAFVNLIVGRWVGMSLSMYAGWGARIIDTVIILPLIVPYIAVISGLHVIMIRIGLVDNFFSVVVVNLLPTLPYSIKIFQNAYTDVGKKYFDHAILLGANKLETLFCIDLEILRETFEYVFVLSFAIALSQYAITEIIGGGAVISLSMIYFPFFNSTDESFLASFSLVFMMLPICAMLVFRIALFVIKKIAVD